MPSVCQTIAFKPLSSCEPRLRYTWPSPETAHGRTMRVELTRIATAELSSGGDYDRADAHQPRGRVYLANTALDQVEVLVAAAALPVACDDAR